MNGYVAVTDWGWYKYQSERKRERVLFWRHSVTPVSLLPGDYFSFLIRGKLPRLIKGYGIVEEASSGVISKIWDKYKDLMGYSDLLDLKRGLGKAENERVAYYILKSVKYFPEPTVTDSDIDFDKSIMAGRFSTPQELNFLKEKLI